VDLGLRVGGKNERNKMNMCGGKAERKEEQKKELVRKKNKEWKMKEDEE
jgi:hypothetical protein